MAGGGRQNKLHFDDGVSDSWLTLRLRGVSATKTQVATNFNPMTLEVAVTHRYRGVYLSYLWQRCGSREMNQRVRSFTDELHIDDGGMTGK